MKYLLIFSFFWASTFFHGGHIAEYHYQLDGENLTLKFMIEKEELMNFKFEQGCDFQNMTALCTAFYLNKHSFLKINNTKVDLELQNAYTERDHFFLLLEAKWEGGTIEELSVENKCFYEFAPGFYNRIVLDVAQFQKSYLLSREKTKIELE
jgi:hypothetical protein